MRTVELLLDPDLDAAVREIWERLHAAGLRSLATHTHETNRPHVTLATADHLGGLPALHLPVPLTLGPALPLGRALALSVESVPLRALQARVWAGLDGLNPLHAPVRWVPHVSLALNMPAEQQSMALSLLAGMDGEVGLRGECVAARSYDSRTRTVMGLAGA